MVKRFVLNGPPGSGKSTVLFRISYGDSEGNSKNTMISLDYN
ncbi:MAG: hypothetical protein PHV06_03390 [bacterium]|nr:hypothetical protein [bacterium]